MLKCHRTEKTRFMVLHVKYALLSVIRAFRRKLADYPIPQCGFTRLVGKHIGYRYLNNVLAGFHLGLPDEGRCDSLKISILYG